MHWSAWRFFEEVFINVRQGLYTMGYHFAGCANKAMLDGAQTSPILHSKSGGNIHLLRGKQGNNLLGLDSESKKTRKDVFARKAAYMLTLF